MEKRVFNFSPGPAVLPLPALEEAQRDLLALPGAPATTLDQVSFTEGGTVCGPVTVTNNVATCIVPNAVNTSPFSVTTHTINLGSFTGDHHYTLTSTGSTPLGHSALSTTTLNVPKVNSRARSGCS